MNSLERFARQQLKAQLAPWLVGELYRGILGREADAGGLAMHVARLASGGARLSDVAADFVASEEFRAHQGGARTARAPSGCLQSEAMAVFREFLIADRQGKSGFVTNFMGGQLSVRFIAGLEPLSGAIEDIPIPGNCHGDTLEWLGTLRAVLEARDHFAMIELGAGWAPWCAIGHQGARMRGIEDIRVVALEGDAGHVGFIEEHFRTNGVPPHQATILHGVAGPADGFAEFPRHRAANSDYGGAAAFSEKAEDRTGLNYFVELRGGNVAEIEQLPAYALATLLADFDRVDLVHCDIQGAELEVLSAGIAAATAKVRRVVVGTHSFELDRAMLALFARAGWECEGMFAVEMQEQGALAVTVRDGCQVWRNPTLGG